MKFIGEITNDKDLITKEYVKNHAHDTAIAPEYSSTSTYAVGAVCMHEGVRYKCTTEITTAEAWDPTHWSEESIEELLELVYLCSTDSSESSTPFTDYFSIYGGRITVQYGSIIKLGRHYQLRMSFTIPSALSSDWKNVLIGTDLYSEISNYGNGACYNVSHGGYYPLLMFDNDGIIKLNTITGWSESNTTWNASINWIK